MVCIDNGVCRLAKLKELIYAQTKLDPKFQEIFYENLPYKPTTPIMASQLPVTTVTTKQSIWSKDGIMLATVVVKIKFPQWSGIIA